MVNQIPTPRRSTVGSINQPGLHYQQDGSITGLNGSIYSNAPMNIATQSLRLSPPIPTSYSQAPQVSPPITSSVLTKPRGAQRTPRNDEPIGLVFVDKRKFKCNKPDCKELTFGRMADLRRHYDQTHAKNRVQYFCRVTGCSRAHAETGGRGRSFGTRKDKRDEHERNVHKKERRRESSYSSAENV